MTKNAATRYFIILFAGLGFWSLAGGTKAQEPQKLALLIGNQNYVDKVGPLKHPHEDVTLVGDALEKLGFKVTRLEDLSYRAMDVAIKRYVDDLRRAGPGAISFFYYSGHGAANHENGVNYLVPVDVASADSNDLWYQSFEQSEIIDRLSRQAPGAAHIVVFDACRNELRLPMAAKGLGDQKGFAPVNEVRGMLIAYATSENKSASDTGAFARILSEELPKKVEAVSMFRDVQLRAEREMSQEPWMSLRYLPPVYLAGLETAKPASAAEPKPPLSEAARAWAEIKDLKAPAVFAAFRKQYGASNPLYDTLANQRITELNQQTALLKLPTKPSAVTDEGCADGLLVSVGLSNTRPCVKPGSGESFKDCPDCPEMVVAPAGHFTMGSPESEPEHQNDESPQHKVTIPKPFAVGQFAITVGEYLACVKEGGCKPPEWQEPGSRYNIKTGSDDGYKQLGEALAGAPYPIVGASWNDAKAYVKWLSQRTGKSYRLLSEAEREYATRAGTETPFWWGSSITPEQANYDGTADVYKGGGKHGEYRQKTVPVKSFKPNPWGLYQVHGNVYDWVEDCYHDSYTGAPGDGSAWTTGDCSERVLRGGSWNDIPRSLRSAYRIRIIPGYRYDNFGFRVARTI